MSLTLYPNKNIMLGQTTNNFQKANGLFNTSYVKRSFNKKIKDYISTKDTSFIPSSDELLFILQNIDLAIITQSSDRHLQYCNDKALKLLGFKKQREMLNHYKKTKNFINTTLFTVTNPFDITVKGADLPWENVNAKNTYESSIINLTSKNTLEQKRIQITSHFVQNLQSDKKIIITIITDMTKEAQLEKQKDEFMNMASHELKTPITSMKVFTQTMQRVFATRNDSKPLYYLGKIEGQLNKLTILVKELLDVSKLQAGELQLHKEIFDIGHLVEEIAEHMQYTTEHHKISYKNTMHVDIFADRERLSQVLINLLSNAIKYSKEKTKIMIKTSVSNEDVLIEVKDQGIGITKEDQKDIFDRFSKVTGKKESTFPGMGVGLYIAAQIIKRHNGTIRVKSKKDNGSTFSITLPLQNKHDK